MYQSQILVVDDDSQLREAIVDTLMITGYACIEASNGDEALSILLKRNVDMVISDIQMDGMDGHTLLRSIRDKYPQMPVLLMTAYANIDGAVKAMRDGAIDYLAKPFAPEVLLNQVSRYVPVKRITKREPIWEDPSTGELLQLAAKAAASDVTVMITGPSGSGKEVLSRYVHDNSPRASGPFVAINCAAIPDTMLESTLFGYEKGAFTGAVQACPGKFEQAQGGTILLDEITEMDLNLQSKLLRVLQEKEVERLGGRKTIALDVRVLATSNRDLKQAVAENKFREDLYYRLNVFPLRWKPLCQRIGDVLPLARFFLQRHASENSRAIPELSKEAIARLESYSWPGNVRELENVMQRALIICNGNVIEASDLILDEALSSAQQQAMSGIAPVLAQEQVQSNPNNMYYTAMPQGTMANAMPPGAAMTAGAAMPQGAMPNNMGGGAVANNSAISSQPFNTFIPNIQGFGQGNNTFIPSAFSQNNMMGAANQASVAPNEAPSGQAPVDANTASADQESPMDFVRNQKIPSSLGGELKQQEYQAILEALVDCRGNRQAVADKLGISPRTLRYKIARMREEGMVIPS
ncbi:sigma 54-interacting transcriptional regulator [Anaerobiospirillum sp. NML120448]|uniref:sigma 54-interacting transcriptional regulator n=1 Tax=Anaerobiospirillum sp. NML120448 TaxID=2932816 RepID=UPI001FF2D4D1|nr:sigma 54-interacting transcriptional regulator [Anaerobiospirillum sp. NML120448]MCK0513383.1 sigma 54-interacting transcriptional regulator [Anaerobiospirillum sp. NML120448]